jgi:hypothetical protein
MKYTVNENGILKEINQENVPVAQVFDPTLHNNSFINNDLQETLNNLNGDIVENLCHEFSKHEIPIGLIKPLVGTMSEFDTIDFIIDDSSSMNEDTDSIKSIKSSITIYHSRWEEVHQRILQIVDIIVHLPISKIYIGFMNNKSWNTMLSRDSMNSFEFKDYIHNFVNNKFSNRPSGYTPTAETLKAHFKLFNRASHYLFTDGVPSDGIDNVISVVTGRNASNHPITFVSCTNNSQETEWMKLLDNNEPNIAEVDDYESEKTEVLENQGSLFPYTKGLWLLCLIAGSTVKILDDIDENKLFSKKDMEFITGRNLSSNEYNRYVIQHPSNNRSLFKRLKTSLRNVFFE